MPAGRVLVNGGTGYLGTRLIVRLIEQGHHVRAAVRNARAMPLHANLEVIMCDVFDADDVARVARGCTTLVHLIGTRKPAPWKAAQFEAVDLASARAAARAAVRAGVKHIVYVSVAQPAPVMRAYQAARAGAEAAFAATGIALTVLRPWYVLGPGHRWPVILLPLYKLFESIPSTRASARRLGLVTAPQMVHALVDAIEHPHASRRYVDVPGIRSHT